MTTPINPDSTRSASQPLGLEDIITPTNVDAWPPAIGWWLLLCTLAIVAALLFIAFRRHQKKWRYRKEALALLKDTFKQWEDSKIEDEKACHDFFRILKRTAITAYPDKRIDSLYGEKWINILKKQAPGLNKNPVIFKAISLSQYEKKIGIEPESVFIFCEKWIKQHKNQWQEAI